MGGAYQGGDSGSEGSRGAGAHRLDVGGVAQVEAAVAVGRVGWEAVDGVGQAGAASALNPAADTGIGTVRIATARGCEGVEGRSIVAVVGERDGAWGTGGVGGCVLGAGGVGGGGDGKNAASLCGEFDVAGVGEVEAVVSGGGDEDDVGLGRGVGDLVEGSEESSSVSGGQVGGSAYRQGDDVGTIGDGVFDAFHDPAEESAGFTGFALVAGICVAGDGGWHTLEDFDVEYCRGGGYADDFSGPGADGSGGERRGPCAVTLLILGAAVVAGAGVCALVDFGKVKGQIWGDIRVGSVDAAVEDGNADAFAHGGIPRAVCRCAGGVISVAANLLDGPSLRSGGVVGVVGGRSWRRSGRRWSWERRGR